MNFTFEQIQETFPKHANRSKRLRKKLHVDDFAEIMFSFTLKIPVFDLSPKLQDACLDIMCEHDAGCFIFSDSSSASFSVLSELLKKSVKNQEEIISYITNLISKLSEVEKEFRNIDAVHVTYGDAYYGEW